LSSRDSFGEQRADHLGPRDAYLRREPVDVGDAFGAESYRYETFGAWPRTHAYNTTRLTTVVSNRRLSVPNSLIGVLLVILLVVVILILVF
jgi:hypothetical protein